MPAGMIMILNTPARNYREGGNVREYALSLWAQRHGVETWLIQDDTYRASRRARLLAVPRALGRLWRRPGATILLGYPGFPFFWNLDSAGQLLRAFAFIAGCKLVAIARRQRIIIDIMDLIRFQHIDLKYHVGLPKWLFKAFDRGVYHLASQLWVCSSGIADQIRKEMYWGRDRVLTVENGAFPSAFDDLASAENGAPKVFMYAGQLFETRGVPMLIDEFCRSTRADVELRLCGVGGDWIPSYTTDPRVKHLGQLDEDQVAEAIADIDMGIVFQPKGFYYDMVYPTKLPLYLARGKAVLATDNPELARAVNEKGVGLVSSLDRIAVTIDDLTAESVADYRQQARRIRHEVYWDKIYDAALANFDSRFGSRGARP